MAGSGEEVLRTAKRIRQKQQLQKSFYYEWGKHTHTAGTQRERPSAKHKRTVEIKTQLLLFESWGFVMSQSLNPDWPVTVV